MPTTSRPVKRRFALAARGLPWLLLLALFFPAGSFGEEQGGVGGEEFHVRGKVVDPAGKPFAGAEVLAVAAPGHFLAATESDETGSFELQFPKLAASVPRLAKDWQDARLLAKAPGYGAAWVGIGELEANSEPTLRLVGEHPIQGRILDLEGRPIAGAKLRLLTIYGNDTQDLDGFLKTARDQPLEIWRYAQAEMRFLSAKALALSADAPPEEETEFVLATDEAGRFELRGIGRECVVRLELTGPAIESRLFAIITRPEIEPKWKRQQPNRDYATRVEMELGSVPEPIYPATFNHFAPPSRPITGIVRDRETGRPLKGIRVGGSIGTSYGTAVTDEQGRYVLEGLGVEGILGLNVYGVPEGMPYLLARRGGIKLSATASPTPGETDFELARGVIVRGRLLDEATGEPIDGYVEYLAFSENPFVQQLPDRLAHKFVDTSGGRFEITALPGPGMIGARAPEDRFEIARGEDFGRPPDEHGRFSTVNRGLVRPDDFHTVAAIDPEPRRGAIEIDLVFRSGATVTGILVDPDGHAVSGVEARGISGRGSRAKLDGAEFTVFGLRSGEERTIVFRHPARKLGAVVTVTDNEAQPVTVRLRSLATLTGRIVDRQGRPIPGVMLVGVSEGAMEFGRKMMVSGQRPPGPPPIELNEDRLPTVTDADGYFRMTGLLSGISAELVAGKERDQPPSLLTTFTMRSGEIRDLGDLTLPETSSEEKQEANEQ